MAAEAFAFLHRLAKQGVHAGALRSDSRAILPGDVFVAYPGERNDGRRYIAEAIRAGASAVIWDREDFHWNKDWTLPNLSVDNLKAFAGPLADEFYGHPSAKLKVIAITGTNGKTSCSHWIAQALQQLGEPTAVIGTLGIGFPDALQSNPNTTPDALLLQQALRRFVEQGVKSVAMEASSIGLAQGRMNGVQVDTALYTNLSRDHLDFHADMESYAQAKMSLFRLPGLHRAVLNLDDVQGVRIAQMLHGEGVERIGYSLVEGAALRGGTEHYLEAHNIEFATRGVAFDLHSSWGSARIASALIGKFNVANLLGVLGVLLGRGFALDQIAPLLRNLQSVAGRMQQIGGGAQPLLVVDYAHTPDALDKVLLALRDVARAQAGRLLCVFGCGGDRDHGKRPLMAEAASRHADYVILTSDNPRSEDPQAIIADMLPGIKVAYQIELDRRAAIRAAVAQTGPGDVVLIAGKGHESHQEFVDRELPFSDIEEARAALAAVRP